MTRLRRLATVLCLPALAATTLAFAPVGSAHAAGFCAVSGSFSGITITWTGKGDGKSWDDASNWSPKKVPDKQQIPAIYQTEYVCIGTGKGGHPADVQIAKNDSYHVAGVDIGQGASLTLQTGARLFVGDAGPNPEKSVVENNSTLSLVAAVFGGNGPLTVDGTMHWTGKRVGKHNLVATQTSSECVFDPSIKACPGDTTPGGGLTTIGAGGSVLVDGAKFGGTVLGDKREIDNQGTLQLTGNGFIDMNNNTSLIDEAGSSLALQSNGGIYQGADEGYASPPALKQQGSVSKTDGKTTVLGVPVTIRGTVKPKVTAGDLALDATKTPVARVSRGTSYGVGSCIQLKLRLCHRVDATPDEPQTAMIGTSTAGPKVSKIAVSLVDGASHVHGKPVIGKAIDVKAPTAKTTHSTHLTFSFDGSMKGLRKSAAVYRGKHAITLCKVHGLTAQNTSCIISRVVSHGGPDTNGDLTIVLITIQPNARWFVVK
jgi:hypothetical protein